MKKKIPIKIYVGFSKNTRKINVDLRVYFKNKIAITRLETKIIFDFIILFFHFFNILMYYNLTEKFVALRNMSADVNYGWAFS